MPIYEYQARRPGRSCPRCREPFEVLQEPGEKPLERCPACGAPVSRLISPPGLTRENILSPGNLAEKGFVQYKNVGDGHFEKTAGRGPDLLKGPLGRRRLTAPPRPVE